MKLCCGNGKPYDSLTEAERIGGCNNDHCVGPITIEDYDLLLTGLGTFVSNECTSCEELCKLLKPITVTPNKGEDSSASD